MWASASFSRKWEPFYVEYISGPVLFLLLKWISGICTYRPAALSSNRPPLRHLGVCSHLPHSSVLAIHTWPVKSHSLHRGSSTRHALSLPRSVSSNSNWLSDESIIIPLGCSQQMGRRHSLSIFIVPIRLNPVTTADHQSVYLWGSPCRSLTCSNNSQIKMFLRGPCHSPRPRHVLSFTRMLTRPSTGKIKGVMDLNLTFWTQF